MSKKFGYVVAIIAVLALLVGGYTVLKPNVKMIGTATTGEITYYPGSLNVTHNVAVGEALTAATIDTTGAVTAGGAVGTVTLTTTTVATSAFTAAQICDNSIINYTQATGTTYSLPATSTLFADCLLSDGQYHDVVLLNSSSATTSVIAAGTGGTLEYSSSTTVAATKSAILRIIRTSAIAYYALLVNLPN